jgi:[acyl-carrier-protein] S-malonyltransferase
MGQEFYEQYDIVRELFDMAEETTRVNLSKLCFKGPIENLTMTINLQPAVTAVNLGCLAVLMKEAMPATYYAGHSLGEYSALNAAGVISTEDTFKLVFKRGELMHREATENEGAMHALVGLGINDVDALVGEVQSQGVVSVANHNTETQIVITGAPEPVSRVSALAVEKGAKSIALKVSGAWHSQLIQGAQAEFREFVGRFSFVSPEATVILNVTAEPEKDPDEIRSIMIRQLCSPVKWYDSMLKLIEEQVDTFVEVGPGRVLTGLLKKILPKDYHGKTYNVSNMKQLEKFLKENT